MNLQEQLESYKNQFYSDNKKRREDRQGNLTCLDQQMYNTPNYRAIPECSCRDKRTFSHGFSLCTLNWFR